MLDEKEKNLPRAGTRVEILEENGQIIRKEASILLVYEAYLLRILVCCLIAAAIRGVCGQSGRAAKKREWTPGDGLPIAAIRPNV